MSTGIAVAGNLAPIGGSSSQAFFDNGTNGDSVAGDNVFSFIATVAANTSAGAKNLASPLVGKPINRRLASAMLSKARRNS
jgi:hypothetical protein